MKNYLVIEGLNFFDESLFLIKRAKPRIDKGKIALNGYIKKA